MSLVTLAVALLGLGALTFLSTVLYIAAERTWMERPAQVLLITSATSFIALLVAAADVPS